jgi:hypothetical protein
MSKKTRELLFLATVLALPGAERRALLLEMRKALQKTTRSRGTSEDGPAPPTFGSRRPKIPDRPSRKPKGQLDRTLRRTFAAGPARMVSLPTSLKNETAMCLLGLMASLPNALARYCAYSDILDLVHTYQSQKDVRRRASARATRGRSRRNLRLVPPAN